VRDWASFINELIRVLKPGGLLVSVDGSTNWPVFDKMDDFNTQLLPEQAMERAPGFCRLLEKLFE
jgi:ubiquinone/menaquinone biosynthesis C-methylase UbiE